MKPVRRSSTAWKISGRSCLSRTLPISLPSSLTRERNCLSDLAWKLMAGMVMVEFLAADTASITKRIPRFIAKPQSLDTIATREFLPTLALR
jgi:hypothetical protein